MGSDIEMVEIWRGGRLESLHRGQAVVCDGQGEIIEAWGSPETVIFPRSSCKMLQALPLITSGAADAYGLTPQHLALACASHQGAEIHSVAVDNWLKAIGLGEADLRCGPQEPADIPARDALIRAGESPCQIHNNCSGKHAGFLTLTQHLGAGPEYNEIDHPLQVAIKEAFEDICAEASPGFGIDGCSAPNHAISLHGLARAMGRFASAHRRGDAGAKAAVRLRDAMVAHPELVAGETRACTELMRAAPGVALKTGAEAVFTAILPELDRGIAVKITDGSTRAAEAVIAHLLIRLGALEAGHPAALKRVGGPIFNRRGIETGTTQISPVMAGA